MENCNIHVIVICLIFGSIFLGGCLKSTYMGNASVWSEEKVHAYYASISPADLSYLAAKLVQDGYQWQSDGTNLTPLTDTVARPEFVLSHGGGNCNDWSNLFQDYARHTGAADEYTEYYLRSGYKWHLITIFKIGDNYFEQSNLSVTPTASHEASIERWYAKGYHYRDPIQYWKK